MKVKVKYNNIIIKLIICLLLLLSTDYLLGKMADYCIQHQKSGDYFEFEYKVFHAQPDIAILGSSRANHHYNTLLIDKELQKKVINYGVDGSDILYDYIILKTLIKHQVPQIVILDVRPFEFEEKPSGQAVTYIFPFIKKLDITKSDLDIISPYEYIKVKLNTYRYNNIILSVLANMRGKQESTASISGYVPLPSSGNIFKKDKVRFEKVNTASFHYFEAIANLCKQNNINLKVCISPYYNTITYNKAALLVKEFCNQKDIPFYDYSNSNFLVLNKSEFKDNLHLNATGADRFTNDFIIRALK